ncbi:hypothetical protein [Nocardia sp. X0981]
MADEKLDFTAEQAGRVANKVDAVAGRIADVLATMKSESAAYWGCWGTGETGERFAHGDGKNGYVDNLKHQQKVIASYPEFLSGEKGYSPQFREAAKLLIAMERNNELDIRRSGRMKA